MNTTPVIKNPEAVPGAESDLTGKQLRVATYNHCIKLIGGSKGVTCVRKGRTYTLSRKEAIIIGNKIDIVTVPDSIAVSIIDENGTRTVFDLRHGEEDRWIAVDLVFGKTNEVKLEPVMHYRDLLNLQPSDLQASPGDSGIKTIVHNVVKGVEESTGGKPVK